MRTGTALPLFDTTLINAGFFKALADATRLRLVVALTVAEKPVCVCELVYALQIPQYRVSKHLAVLSRAGLVEGHHRGTWVRYAVAPVLPQPFRECMIALSVTEPFRADQDRLSDRMLLRNSEGVCVVGFLSNLELKERITQVKSGCCTART